MTRAQRTGPGGDALAEAEAEGTGAGAAGPASAAPGRADAEVFVVARDRIGLLARIAAALAASRLEVTAAHIATRAVGEEREAVDVFFVHDATGEPDAAPGSLRNSLLGSPRIEK